LSQNHWALYQFVKCARASGAGKMRAKIVKNESFTKNSMRIFEITTSFLLSQSLNPDTKSSGLSKKTSIKINFLGLMTTKN